MKHGNIEAELITAASGNLPEHVARLDDIPAATSLGVEPKSITISNPETGTYFPLFYATEAFVVNSVTVVARGSTAAVGVNFYLYQKNDVAASLVNGVITDDGGSFTLVGDEISSGLAGKSIALNTVTPANKNVPAGTWVALNISSADSSVTSFTLTLGYERV
jgi:hypothetical protein